MKKRSKFFLILSIIMLLAYAVVTCTVDASYELVNFPLQEEWSITLNGKVEGISIANEQIVLVRTNTILYAVGIPEGNILWQHLLNWQAAPEPAIITNSVTYFADGKAVWALDILDGSVIWKQPVSNGDVHVRTASAKVVAVEDEIKSLTLYDSTNSSLIWSKPVCINAFQPILYETKVYIPCFGLRAIDISSGKDSWDAKEDERYGRVAYRDGVIYFSPEQQSVEAFDLETRTKLWETPLQSMGYTQFEVIEDIVFLTDSLQFCAIHMDGVVLWCAENKNPQNPVVLENSAFIFNGHQKIIKAHDLSNGTEIGRLTLKKLDIVTVYRKLMVSTGKLLIFGSGNKVFAFGQQ